MPENRVLYLGIVLIVADRLAVARRRDSRGAIEWTVAYVGGAGVVVVVLGVALEFRKARKAAPRLRE